MLRKRAVQMSLQGIFHRQKDLAEFCLQQRLITTNVIYKG